MKKIFIWLGVLIVVIAIALILKNNNTKDANLPIDTTTSVKAEDGLIGAEIVANGNYALVPESFVTLTEIKTSDFNHDGVARLMVKDGGATLAAGKLTGGKVVLDMNSFSIESADPAFSKELFEHFSVEAGGVIYTYRDFSYTTKAVQVYSASLQYQLRSLALATGYSTKDRIISNNSLFDDDNTKFFTSLTLAF